MTIELAEDPSVSAPDMDPLRDAFASAALTGLLSGRALDCVELVTMQRRFAAVAYSLADAMLAARHPNT